MPSPSWTLHREGIVLRVVLAHRPEEVTRPIMAEMSLTGQRESHWN